MTDSVAKPAVERRHVSDTEVWLVAAVSYKGERFTHGYAFFAEASALHHIEREKLEDAERAKIGRTELHVSDSWQVVRYVPEQAHERTEAWIRTRDRLPIPPDAILFTNGHDVVQGYWDGNKKAGVFAWHSLGGTLEMSNDVVTHWMPLPSPPPEASE